MPGRPWEALPFSAVRLLRNRTWVLWSVFVSPKDGHRVETSDRTQLLYGFAPGPPIMTTGSAAL
jgi:hypothetical protein